jgi:hypothetical protein
MFVLVVVEEGGLVESCMQCDGEYYAHAKCTLFLGPQGVVLAPPQALLSSLQHEWEVEFLQTVEVVMKLQVGVGENQEFYSQVAFVAH